MLRDLNWLANESCWYAGSGVILQADTGGCHKECNEIAADRSKKWQVSQSMTGEARKLAGKESMRLERFIGAVSRLAEGAQRMNSRLGGLRPSVHLRGHQDITVASPRAFALAVFMFSVLWGPLVARAQAPAPEATYDQALNRTSVETPVIRLKGSAREARVQATFTYNGKVPIRPETVTFRLSTTNPEPVWETFIDQLLWTVDDGKALAPSELTVSDRMEGGKRQVTETITCDMPIALFQTIFHSPQLGIGVHGVDLGYRTKLRDEYKLGPAELAPFVAMLKGIPGGYVTGKPQNDTIVLPFKSVFGYIVVQANINGRGPLNFIVDTGAPTGISQRLAHEMKLKLDGSDTGHTPGGRLEFSLASDIRFQSGDLYGNFDKVPVLPIESISPHIGLRIDGLLGNDLLRRMTVEIDYDTNRITLYDAKCYNIKPEKGAAVLPMKLTAGGLSTVHATLMQGGRSFKGQFGIDSGSNGSISAFAAFSKRTGLRELLPDARKMQQGASGATLAGKADSAVGRIEQVKLGNLRIEAPQLELIGETATAVTMDCDGLIGGRLLRRFRIVLDYARNRMILTKSKRFADSDTGDSVGLLLRAEGDEFYPFKVEGVIERSPAADAELKAGDSILAIDEVPTKGMTLEAVQRLVNRENRESTVTVGRGDATLQVKLRPRRLK